MNRLSFFRPHVESLEDRLQPTAVVPLTQAPLPLDPPAAQAVPDSSFHPLGVVLNNHVEGAGGIGIQAILNSTTYVTGAPAAATGRGVALDADGNSYVVGSFDDGGPNGSQAFLAVYDTNGTQILFNTFQAFDSQNSTYQTLNTEAHGVAVDQVGNIYVVGQTTDGNTGDNDQFLVKFAADGTTVVYATALGGPNQDSGNGVTSEPTPDGADSNVVFTGIFQDAPGSNNVTVAKLDPAGNVIFAFFYTFTGATNGQGNAVALDGLGSAYVAGSINVNGDSDPLMFKLDSSAGAGVQAAFLPNPGTDDAFNAVTVDVGGATVNFGGTLGGVNAVVGKFNADLSAAPVYLVSFADVTTANGLASDAAGNVYLAGSATNPDTGTVQAVVVKLDTTGTPADSLFVGGTGGDSGNAIAYNRNTGVASLAGTTASPDLPVTDGSSLIGAADAFFATLSI